MNIKQWMRRRGWLRKRSRAADLVDPWDGGDTHSLFDRYESERRGFDVLHFYRRNAMLRAAVDRVCDAVAHVPAQALDAEGNVATDAALAAFLRQPNAREAWVDFVGAAARSLELWGECFIEWGNAQGYEAHVLNPRRMERRVLARDKVEYRYRVNNRSVLFEVDLENGVERGHRP